MVTRPFMLKNVLMDRFLVLAHEYCDGAIEVSDIAREMGGKWDVYAATVFLDTFGVGRPIDKLTMSREQKTAVLGKLMHARHTKGATQSESIRQRVLASERIESVFIGTRQPAE